MRSEAIDRVRGLAILVMLADHLLGLVGEWSGSAWFLAPRLTATRVGLPLFLLIAGGLLAGRRARWARVGQVIAGGCFVGWLAAVGGLPWMPQLDILLSIGLGLVLWPWIGGSGVWGVVVCMVLVATFPVFGHAYHPAHVVGVMLLGTLLPVRAWTAWGERLPSWVGSMGRRPLAWYVGHLAVLAGVWWGISSTDGPGRSGDGVGLWVCPGSDGGAWFAVLDAPRTAPQHVVEGDNTPNEAQTDRESQFFYLGVTHYGAGV